MSDFDEVLSPGEHVRQRLEQLNWTQTDLAFVLGRAVSAINDIISGKRNITPEIARELASAFQTTPEEWLRLEQAYQLSQLEKADDSIGRRAKLFSYAPINDMIKRGWIEPSNKVDVLEAQILRFFRCNTLDEIVLPPKHSARKSTSYLVAPTPSQRAWLMRAIQLGESILATEFSSEKVQSAVKRLRPLMSEPSNVRQIPRILSECGIRMVIVQPFPGSKIDGACIWVNDLPIIALSLRFDRIDNFWFCLFHELGHAARGVEALDDDMDDSSNKPEEEQEADDFAQRNLIRPSAIRGFIERKSPIYSTKDIMAFALTQDVHAGIIVGQLHKRKEVDYSKFRNLLVPIREFVTGVTLTDGWGVSVPVSY